MKCVRNAMYFWPFVMAMVASLLYEVKGDGHTDAPDPAEPTPCQATTYRSGFVNGDCLGCPLNWTLCEAEGGNIKDINECKKTCGGNVRQTTTPFVKQRVGSIDQPNNSPTDQPKNSATDQPKNSATDQPMTSAIDQPKSSTTDQLMTSVTTQTMINGKQTILVWLIAIVAVLAVFVVVLFYRLPQRLWIRMKLARVKNNCIQENQNLSSIHMQEQHRSDDNSQGSMGTLV